MCIHAKQRPHVAFLAYFPLNPSGVLPRQLQYPRGKRSNVLYDVLLEQLSQLKVFESSASQADRNAGLLILTTCMRQLNQLLLTPEVEHFEYSI